jgi:hypothetical protein
LGRKESELALEVELLEDGEVRVDMRKSERFIEYVKKY